MSQETMQWLNTMTLIGFSEKRGNAWHYRKSDQGAEPNHYVGPVPVEDVERRLFSDEYIEVPVTFEVGGKTYVDPSSKHIVRVTKDDAFRMGTFKQGYKIHGFRPWLISNVENILKTSTRDGLAIGSAGLLKNGAVAWCQFETPETHKVAGVEFRPFITSATSLDGSLKTTYLTGGQLIVCDNTLSAGLAGASGMYKVRHTSRSLDSDKLDVVRDALGILYETTEDLMTEIHQLADTSVSERLWAQFLDTVAKVDPAAKGRGATLALNKRDALETLWKSDPRVAPWSGTAYGVVAAMNTFDQHIANVRNVSRPERNALNMVKGQFIKTDGNTLRVLQEVKAKRRALKPEEVKVLVKA